MVTPRLQEIARRPAAIAEMALDVQVVVNVNSEDQGVVAGRRLAQIMSQTRMTG